MKVIDGACTVYTNYEVLIFLQGIKARKTKNDVRCLATIVYEILHYLEDLPCKLQTRESILNYVTDLKQYNIKSFDILSLVNQPPVTELDFQLCVDDRKRPLANQSIAEIIKLGKKHFFSKATKPDMIEAVPTSSNMKNEQVI